MAKDALALYRDALAGWRQTNSTWDEAMTGLDMALLLDSSEPEVAATVESTREILERLGVILAGEPESGRTIQRFGRVDGVRVPFCDGLIGSHRAAMIAGFFRSSCTIHLIEGVSALGTR